MELCGKVYHHGLSINHSHCTASDLLHGVWYGVSDETVHLEPPITCFSKVYVPLTFCFTGEK